MMVSFIRLWNNFNVSEVMDSFEKAFKGKRMKLVI